MRFRLNSDVRKEKENWWLNAIKTKLVKGRLNFSRKTAQQQLLLYRLILVESLSNTWVKNNHITVDMTHYLGSLLVYVFLRV